MLSVRADDDSAAIRELRSLSLSRLFVSSMAPTVKRKAGFNLPKPAAGAYTGHGASRAFAIKRVGARGNMGVVGAVSRLAIRLCSRVHA